MQGGNVWAFFVVCGAALQEASTVAVDLRSQQAEMDQTQQRIGALYDRNPGPASAWTEEDRREGASLDDRAQKLMIAIEDAKGAERRANYDRLRAYGNEPIYKIPHGVNADDDGRKKLMGAGWEIKNGAVHIPTSLGITVETYPEEVLFGPVPMDDMYARDYFGKTRAIIQPEYRAAYVKFMSLSAKSRSEGIAFTMLTGPEQKALSEGTDSAGGYLVPPDIMAEILARVAQDAIVRSRARVVNTSRDMVKWPRLLPHTTLGSIYSSGFVGTWAGETPAFTDTDPGFGMFDIPVRKIRVATKLSNDLIADAITNVPAFLARNGAENMALVEDEGFLNGDGSALRPQGILNGGAASIDVEGTTPNTISNTNANLGSATKLITLNYTLPAQYASRAVWVMRRNIEGKVRALVDGAGRFLWPPMVGSAFTGNLPPLFNGPVLNSDFMPDEGTDANKVFIYGDLSQYIIVQRAQIS